MQSALYTYDFKPSQDIAIIKIDDASLNTLQAKTDQKMLTIPKSTYIDLIEKLESVGVKGIAFDIVFQNRDPDEERFAETMKKYGNIVIATTLEEGKCEKDQDTNYETCEGKPRSVYQDISHGYIAIAKDAHTYTSMGWKNLSAKLFSWSLSDEENPLITYFGPPWSYGSISFVDTLSLSKLDLVRNFAWKYIFIGESGTLIHDQFISPVSATMMDGVESHAHILDGYLKNRHLSDFTFHSGLFFLLVWVLALVLISLSLLLPKYLSPVATLWVLVVLVWWSRYAYFHFGHVYDIAPLLLAGWIFSFPVTFIYRFFIIDREKRTLTKAFAHYVDPRVVGDIASRSEDINLWGESRELTVFFSDIAGFTTISERLAPMDLFSLMSSYLSRMTEILTKNGGTLDKYIGDAVMGFFGAPITLPDHASRACETALAMRSALPEFNNELTKRWLDPIDFRVGIATGEVMVGNIWSYDRFNYTVLGDTVNLASRLEATSKEYGTHIIIAWPTYDMVADLYHARPLDRVAVKGKTEWVMIYELLAKKSETLDLTKYENYARALDLYFSGKYLEAGQLWEPYMTDDDPSRIMALRCHDILEGKVVVEGGVYRMTHK